MWWLVTWQPQAITWHIADSVTIGPIRKNFSEIWIKIHKKNVSRRWIWICFLQNGKHFFSGYDVLGHHRMVLMIIIHAGTLCHQISNISGTLGNKNVDHSDHCIFILDLTPLTPGFNGLGKYNSKMRREPFKFSDLVWLILEVWRYWKIQRSS